jgi:hypothetical protein
MVVKIPPYYTDSLAHEIEYLLHQGRKRDAIAKAVAALRAGTASVPVQALVADMLLPAPKGRGRPKALPRDWYEIGVAFQDLRDGGMTYEDAVPALAKKFGSSESAVEKTVRMYRAAVKEAHED